MKKVFIFFLSLLFAFSLCSCSSGEDTGTNGFTINPDLETALGKEWVKNNADTIDDLVSELRECYKQYQQDDDTYGFGTKVEEIHIAYEIFLNNIHELVAEKSEAVLAGYYEDQSYEGAIMILRAQTTQILYTPLSWSLAMSLMEIGSPPGTAETDPNWDELATDLIDYINNVSEFFYCEQIAE